MAALTINQQLLNLDMVQRQVIAKIVRFLGEKIYKNGL